MLDFSDTSFAEFFASELKVNIDDPKFSANGGSKGKRLRYFLQQCDDPTAVRVLAALWEHRCEYLARSGAMDPVANAGSHYQRLIDRLSDGILPKPVQPASAPVVDRQKVANIKSELLRVSSLSAQARGFAFEGFLKGLCSMPSDLPPKSPFGCAVSRSMAASSSAATPIFWKQNGTASQSGLPISTPSTARSSRKRPGREACS